MKKSLELLREKMIQEGWTKEASRVSTLLKWAENNIKKGRYGIDNGATVDYDPSNGASITVHYSDKLGKYPQGSTYQQGAGGDEGQAFDVLFSLIKKKVETPQ